MNKNKIEKIIHFVWVGKKPKPHLVLKCIESWKKYCPDYVIKEWNEDSFDINSHLYTQEAYKKKKWAFVSDYIRLYALQKYGGVYMDSDLEVYKNIDKFLVHSFFSGFESNKYPITAIMGSEKDHPLINDLLQEYKSRPFIKNGKIDYTVNTEIITKVLSQKYNIDKNKNTYQIGKNDVHIYPDITFCANATIYGSKVPEEAYTRHHFNFSWESPTMRIKRYLNILLKIIYYIFFDWKKLIDKTKYKFKHHNKFK